MYAPKYPILRPVFDPQSEANERKLFLIRAHLEVFVPLAIGEMKRQDGPTDLQFERARGYLPAQPPDKSEPEESRAYWEVLRRTTNPLADRGDAFLFGGKPGEAGAYMGQLTWSLAVMAFQPGGVTVFGLHFEEKPEDADA